MPRLFTGLEIPPQLRTYLSFLQSGMDNVRWIEPGDFHITLRFIGDVSRRDAQMIVEALSSRSWVAPSVRLGELKAFGNSRPSSIYASVHEDERLNRLAATQERLMQRLGLPPDRRRFTPHVTIARLRGGAKPQAVANYLAAHGGFSAPSFQPARFVLYSARESTGGGPYVVEDSWPLEQSDRMTGT